MLWSSCRFLGVKINFFRSAGVIWSAFCTGCCSFSCIHYQPGFWDQCHRPSPCPVVTHVLTSGSSWLFIAIQFQLLQAKWELNMWVWTGACSFCQCQGVWENRSCYESRIMGANPFLSDWLILTVQQTGQSCSQWNESHVSHPFSVHSSLTRSRL